MTRLNVEDLEGRALMSANVVAVAAPGVDAVVRVLDTGDSRSGPTASRLTDWSFQWGQWAVEPIGGNQGSFMGDGFGLDGTSRTNR
jgi:hypothetical protein